MTTARPSTRTRLRLGAGLTLAGAFVLAAPLAASAHVTVSPDQASADAYSVLTFAFSHGCDGSPTTSIAIDFPEGIAAAAPTIAPGWSIEVIGADTGIPTGVIYTADAPVASGLRAAFDVQVKFSADDAGETLAFPVVQTCVDGSVAWVEIPAEGEDPHELDAPAPTVTVGAVAASEHAGTDAGASHAPSDTGTEAADADPVARWLAAGGIVAGLAALGVALTARARKRA